MGAREAATCTATRSSKQARDKGPGSADVSKRDQKSFVWSPDTSIPIATRDTAALPRNAHQGSLDGPQWHCGRRRAAVGVLWLPSSITPLRETKALERQCRAQIYEDEEGSQHSPTNSDRMMHATAI